MSPGHYQCVSTDASLGAYYVPGPGQRLKRRQRRIVRAWWRGSPKHHSNSVRLDVLHGQSIQKTEGLSPRRDHQGSLQREGGI